MVYRPNYSSGWVEWSGSVVHGPQSRHYIVGPKPRGTAVGVSFRPGGVGYVLGVAMSELADRHVCLAALWGRRAEQLRQRLAVATNPRTAFQVMERYLSARIQAPLLMHPAVAYALASSGQTARVADIQRRTGYSPRYFIAKFNESVGVTPKQYYRIQRFNRVTQRLASNQQIALADLAAALGYFDQAHLTREFREFAGVAPTRYSGEFHSPLHHRLAASAGEAERR
jgi:AraC-like DNA-binding protein